VRISNATALAACAKSAMGLSLHVDWMVEHDIADGRLVNVLPSGTTSGVQDNQDTALWVVMPSWQFVPAKNRAFVEFLQNLMM